MQTSKSYLLPPCTFLFLKAEDIDQSCVVNLQKLKLELLSIPL